jgi:radical SAM superfamily enzyme YgiQ (UPF0313 family)
MKLRVLLVNPWIYDFAAYNLWSRPLGLIRVAEYLDSFDSAPTFLDCTDSFEIRKFGTGRFRSERVEKPSLLRDMPRNYSRYGISTDEFVQRVKQSLPVDIVLMTCLMGYWYPGVQKATELVREIMGDVPVILGGIYATLYHEHASTYSGVDFVYKGALKKSINFALKTFGFRLRKRRRTEVYCRSRLYYGAHLFAPVQTATGCPFRCRYCASDLLAEGYSRRPAGEILNELAELCDMGVRDFAFYDDALLFDAEDHIKPILRKIVDRGLNARLHAPNGLHARFLDREVAGLMKAANFCTIRLGLETVDRRRQNATGNKVSNEELERAVRYLKGGGFTKKEIGVYLMYGLPGQLLEEVREGVEFLKRLNVRINLAEFSPIRGTKSWEELVQNGVIEENLDPLLTNNTVFSYLYSGYDPGEIEEMKLGVKAYNASD